MSDNTLLLYDFSVSDIGAPPALDLEEMFYQIKWENGKQNISDDDVNNLEEGRRFLESVKRGQEISQRASEKGLVCGDLKDYDAYHTTEVALQPFLNEKKLDFRNTVEIALKVINLLLDRNDPGLPDNREIEIARRLFLSISQAPPLSPVVGYLSGEE